MMSDHDYKHLLNIASAAAIEAGKFLLNNSSVDRTIHTESKHDVKIVADKQSEAIVLDLLSKQTDFPILSEEAGLSSQPHGALMWVVDPIDGTLNFEKRIPLSCVSIGLWKGNEPILGVIYDFYRQELFSGIASEGAWLNGVPIKVSVTGSKSKAVMFTGFPGGANLDEAFFNRMIQNIKAYRKLRWIGSAALSLAYVACGRADSYEEQGIMFWDIAGGIPIILGAGGTCRFVQNGGEYGFNVFASNRELA
jgi:myo-inositol-1(or 4)-monophosphatase